MESNSDVFVIGATNRPDLLDKALLRGGRFDRLLYLGMAEDHAAQQRILEAVVRRFVLAPDVSLATVAAACPMNLSGADFYALAADAYLQAIKSAIASGASEVTVGQAHFLAALAALQPSVSMEELRRYQQIRASFEASQEPG